MGYAVTSMLDKILPAKPENDRFFFAAFAMALALIPLVSFLSPRFLSIWPGVIGVVFALWHWATTGFMPRPGKWVVLFFFVLLSLAGSSALWALNPEFALSRTGKLALILVPGLALIGIAESIDVSRLRPWRHLIAYACLAVAGLTALDIFFDFPLGRPVHGIAYGEYFPASTRNRSVIAIMAMGLIGHALVAENKAGKAALLLAAPLAALALFTQSQSAQLGLVLAALSFFFFPYSRKAAWNALIVILVAGIFLAPFIAIWMFDHWAAAILDAPFLGAGQGFGSQRLEIWDEVARKALESPFRGFGIEATRAVEAFDTAQLYRQGITELHPHNFTLQLWIEFGLPGALLGAAFFFFLLNALSRCSYGSARSALPVLMFLLPVISFGYGLWQSWLVGLLVYIFAFVRLAMRMYESYEDLYGGS